MDVAASVRLFDLLRNDRSSFFYSGDFPDAHTANLIAIGEAISSEGDNSKRLTYVMVEAYQNIIRHRANDIEAGATGTRSMFAVRAGDGTSDILAINPVCHKETSSLERLLGRLDGLDKAQLKELFLDRLKGEGGGNRGGAGLGLIEMARRSGQALEHRISPITEKADLFTLGIRFGGGANGAGALGGADQLYRAMTQERIIVGHAGVWNATAQQALWQVLGAEKAHGKVMARAYLAAAEFLQGLSTIHSMLAFAVLDDRAKLTLVIEATADEEGSTPGMRPSVDAIRLLEELASLDRFTLDRRYKTALLDADKSARSSMALLDLAMHAREPLEHRWMDRNTSWLLLVTVPL